MKPNSKVKPNSKKKVVLTPQELAMQEEKKRSFSLLQEARRESHELGRQVGRKEGIEIGKKEGILTGKEQGYKSGHQVGEEVGLKIGNREGRKEAAKEAAQVIYPGALSEGKIGGIRNLVTSIETQMAKAAGYQDREKWAKEATVPAWWIAVLIENWEPSLKIKDSELGGP